MHTRRRRLQTERQKDIDSLTKRSNTAQVQCQTDRQTVIITRSLPVPVSLTMTENMFGIGILYLVKDLRERSLSDREHSAGYTQHTKHSLLDTYHSVPDTRRIHVYRKRSETTPPLFSYVTLKNYPTLIVESCRQYS